MTDLESQHSTAIDDQNEPVLWNERERIWSRDNNDAQAVAQLRETMEKEAADEGNVLSGQDGRVLEKRHLDSTKGGKEKLASETKGEEPIWVNFEPDDPESPYNWPARKKRTTIWLVCFFTFLTAFSGSSYQLGEEDMRAKLNASHELVALGLSTFPLGFGLAPLVLAPFSEAFGRWAVYVISIGIYTAFTIGTALANSITTVIVTRFLAGLAASSGSTLVGGSIADVYHASNRGVAMNIFSVGAFAGTGLGPVCMGYVGQNLGFRWIQGIQAIVGGLLTIAVFFFTEETRGSVILSRRAKRMRKETGDVRYQCKSDAERASLAILVKVSLTRPLYLLATEAIVFFFSLWAAIAWGVLYLSLPAASLIFGNVYRFSTGEVGLTFLSFLFAAVVGGLTNQIQERLYRTNVAKRGPEARLYAACVGGIGLPLGIFMLGATQGRTHWFGPVASMAIFGTSIYTIYLAVFNYLADSYGMYASSALSGQSLCRNLAGFAFPLFTNQLFESIGYTDGCMLAGSIAAVLALTPFVLFRFGPQIRARSKFAQEMAKLQR